jgi:hypothetical protein
LRQSCVSASWYTRPTVAAIHAKLPTKNASSTSGERRMALRKAKPAATRLAYLALFTPGLARAASSAAGIIQKASTRLASVHPVRP